MNKLAAAALIIAMTPSVTSAASVSVETPFSREAVDMETECRTMYTLLNEDDLKYPIDTIEEKNYCTLRTEKAAVTMSSSDFAHIVHRSMRMACKGKREILFDLVTLLSGCGGGTRSISATPKDDGSCSLAVTETSQNVTVPPERVADFKRSYEDMSVLERLAIKTFAPSGSYELLGVVSKCFNKSN